jgi:HAE1 family hydrophobic/amphiphilic exporter-1
MGTAVFWGMLLCTVVGVFIIPGLFAMMERLGSKKKAPVPAPEQPTPAPAGGH